jgi:hypothetical protein
MRTVKRDPEKGSQDDHVKAEKQGVMLDTEYEVVGGVIYGFSSYFNLKGIDGQFNCAIFDKGWEDFQDIMRHEYCR